MRVATDIGGTFTDLVAIDQSGVVVAKADTTPPAYEEGVLRTIGKAGLDPADFDFFAHGTTVVINALLSRRGVKTALLTTRGFRDVLEIARGNRPDLFNLAFQKPAPFVPRYLRHEITERIDYQGTVVTPIETAEIAPIVTALRAEGVEAIAICFLHAYVNPQHEQAAVDALRALWPEVSIIASHRVCGEWREYERSSTAVLSAYIHPIAKKYLTSLKAKLVDRGLRNAPLIMSSNGGIATVEGMENDPIAMVESGPASGVLGAAALGRMIGEPDLIALDIGGTTAKTALIEAGEARITTDYRIEWDRSNPGYPIRTAVIDLVEIGNGGGSIAWIDKGGKLHVGPQSAGAQPGPAAYGRGGTEPTTTDANVLLGRINPKLFLGGAQEPDMDNVVRAFQALADDLGGSPEDVARGVIRIANANMVNALKLVSLNRGYDPREFALVAFGGGGAMHAMALADELMVRKVIIPVNSSVFSAWGMLMCDLRRDFLRTRVTPLDEAHAATLSGLFDALERDAVAQSRAEGIAAEALYTERFADMRYRGQEHTVKVAVPTGPVDAGAIQTAAAAFHQAHKREFTFALPDNPVELVNVHIVVRAGVDKPDLPRRAATATDVGAIQTGTRRVDLDEHGVHDCPCYNWAAFTPAMTIDGPAILEDATAALVITPGRRAEMDAFGNVHIDTETGQ